MGDEEERGFKVIDRRGGEEEQAPPEPESPPPAFDTPPAAERRAEPQGEALDPNQPSDGMPAIDFTTFVLSLGTSALYHMGLLEDPATGQRAEKPDPLLARQTIDTLEMLQNKTRGNLEDEEARVLDSLLYELRIRFVELGS